MKNKLNQSFFEKSIKNLIQKQINETINAYINGFNNIYDVDMLSEKIDGRFSSAARPVTAASSINAHSGRILLPTLITGTPSL